MTRPVLMTITRVEALHLDGMVEQFVELLEATVDPRSDQAVARLVPDAYADDPAAAREFRRLTQRELLERRLSDAETVRSVLGEVIGPHRRDLPLDDATEEVVADLTADQTGAFLRTLAAIRLVLASRLGIESEDDHDPEDGRFGIYEWLGYRLDALVQAVDSP